MILGFVSIKKKKEVYILILTSIIKGRVLAEKVSRKGKKYIVVYTEDGSTLNVFLNSSNSNEYDFGDVVELPVQCIAERAYIQELV